MTYDCMSLLVWLGLAAGALIGLLEVLDEYVGDDLW